MNEYVVYQHRRSDNNEIFYIGQGKLSRAYEKGTSRSEGWRSLVLEAGGFIAEILDSGLSKDEAIEIEEKYIHKYGIVSKGGILVNERLSGTRGLPSGYVHSEEKKKEISERTKEAMKDSSKIEKLSNSLKEYFKDPSHREELSSKMKVIMSGENHSMYGKHHSEETRKKMSEAKKGKKLSQERIEKMKGRVPWNKGLRGKS